MATVAGTADRRAATFRSEPCVIPRLTRPPILRQVSEQLLTVRVVPSTLAPGYDGHLLFANDINDAGQISGAATSAATGETVAFVATPNRRRH